MPPSCVFGALFGELRAQQSPSMALWALTWYEGCSMRWRLIVIGFLLAGCAGTKTSTAPPRVGPPSPSVQPTASVPSQPPIEQKPLTAVPAAPDECTAFRDHTALASASCTDRTAALRALDRALAEADALARDNALAQLGGCGDLEPGLVMALRAEFAPAACADALVNDFAEQNKSKLAPAIYDALSGLKLAAQLTRLVRTAPRVDPPHTKATIDAFVCGIMAQWATAQANAISTLSLRGARLSGYGKGLVAVEAGMADMRFVEVFRQVPLPEEFAGDGELTDAYYSALDQGLEPRKARGRDAALVGLRVLSEVGVLKDARLVQARSLLSQLFNGRRIDALDSLLVPPLAKPSLPDERHRLAAKLPTFYVDFVLGPVEPSETSLLRALLERGLPASLRSKLDRSVLSAESRQLYARTLFESGRTFWRTPEFSLASRMATTREPIAEENKLIAALSRSLEKGPADAAAMMLGSTKLDELGDSAQLEALAKSKGSLAALAMYDAAIIKELGSAGNSNSEFFRDLAARYERAAGALKDPAQKKQAHERAAAAAETAKKLR